MPSAKTVIINPARATLIPQVAGDLRQQARHHELGRAHQERPQREHVDDERESLACRCSSQSTVTANPLSCVRGLLLPGTDRAPQRLATAPNLGAMDTKSEIRDFLTSRRARITPEEAGLKVFEPAPRTGAPSRGGGHARRAQRRLLQPHGARKPRRRLRQRARRAGRRTCGSTKQNAHTCSDLARASQPSSRPPARRARHASHSVPACSGCSTR